MQLKKKKRLCHTFWDLGMTSAVPKPRWCRVEKGNISPFLRGTQYSLVTVRTEGLVPLQCQSLENSRSKKQDSRQKHYFHGGQGPLRQGWDNSSCALRGAETRSRTGDTPHELMVEITVRDPVEECRPPPASTHTHIQTSHKSRLSPVLMTNQL